MTWPKGYKPPSTSKDKTLPDKENEWSVCTHCNKSNPPNSKFCNQCGSKLNPTCSKCGNTMNLPNSSFCNQCGARMNTYIIKNKLATSIEEKFRDFDNS